VKKSRGHGAGGMENESDHASPFEGGRGVERELNAE